ncbi:MAG: hypothetical protein AB1505_06980 [Candidatus Latescibacterota bacterium]
MPAPRLVLVASTAQQAHVLAIAARTPLAGVCGTGRRRLQGLPVPLLRGLPCIPGTGEACCFLTAVPGLTRCVLELVRQGVHVLCAGPPAAGQEECARLLAEARARGVRLAWGGRHRDSALHLELVRQVGKPPVPPLPEPPGPATPGQPPPAHLPDHPARGGEPAFGQPVHLRLLAGCGNGLLEAWWALCGALEQALDLVPGPVEAAHATAARRRGLYHATLTLRTAARALVQLVAAPAALSLAGEVSLLGTGGLLAASAAGGNGVLAGPAAAELLPRPALLGEPGWIARFLCGPGEPGLDGGHEQLAGLQAALLTGLRLSLRRHLPVPVSVPLPAGVAG